jgi:hypothetical protein
MVPLAWVGGAGGTAALRISLDGGPAEALAEWPEPSDEFRPASWARVTIGAPQADRVRAGSAFVDGRGGYLVLPHDVAPSGGAVTFEVWARVVEDDCGTLLGGGFDDGYWIGVCGVVQYRRPGGTYTRTGQTSVSEGWHHVVLTVDSAGAEVLYVDGVVDLRVRAAKPGTLRREAPATAPESSAVARVPFRVGSDAQAPDELNDLHAYISDVRIWGRARTQTEIRRLATSRLSGREPGLRGLWQFAEGFRDAVGGQRAGVVGFASLAMEPRTPSATQRPVAAIGPPITAARPRIPPWDGRLPVVDAAVRVDGWCRPDEYEQAAIMSLEPARGAHVQAMIARDALYLCSGILIGALDRGSTFTVHLGRDGAARTARSQDDLEITVSGDGSVSVRPQDGRVPARDSVRSIVAAVVGGARLDLQPDDFRPVDAPWWSAEVRIPLTALAPFQLDDAQLRFALDYTSDPRRLPGDSARRLATGRWPAALDAAAPASWTAARVTRETLREPTRIKPRSRTGFDPTAADFNTACPDDWHIKPAYVGLAALKWPQVDPGIDFVWAEGKIVESHISVEDSPLIHNSHDVDMKLIPRQEDRWLLLETGEEEKNDELVLETELNGLPARARALPGDRVIAGGRWIFDCGHGAKTEIHPTPVFVTDRLEIRPVRPDKPYLQQVRVMRIWLNSKPGAFSYYFDGPLTFHAALPYGHHPFARVVEADLPPAITRFGDSVAIQVTPPASGKFYLEIVLGMLSPGFYASGAKAYTATVDQIDVLDDHDSGMSDCNGLNDCGEWWLAMHLNGGGRTIWNNREVWDEDNPWNINQSFGVAGGALNLHVSGYEDDDLNLGKLTDNFAGDDIGQSRQAFWPLGDLAGLCCGNTHTFNAPGGSWRMRFRVTEGAPASLHALPESAHPFWTSRLVDEPNDVYFTSLGTLTPTPGAPATVTRAASLIEASLVTGGVHLLGSDEDRYQVTLGDFATVTGELLEGGPAKVVVVPAYPVLGDVPQSVKNLIGYTGAEVRVSTAGDWGDLPYTLRVRATYKVLPPDWGETADAKPDGRIVDLATPDPATEVFAGGKSYGGWPLPPYRRLTSDWAWQHVAGDEDTYTILFPKPPVLSMGEMVFSCEYNEPASLELKAYNERIVIPALGLDSAYRQFVIGLSSKFPQGKVKVKVLGGGKAPRTVYRLTATWHDAVFYTPAECQARHDFEVALKIKLGTKTIPADHPPYGFPKPQPDPELIDPSLGAGAVWAYIPLGDATAIDFWTAATDGQAVTSRLYNLDGVLLAESIGATGAARLVTRGLSKNQTLLLQIVPAVAGGTLGTVALTSATW